MGGEVGRWALLAVLLGVPFLGALVAVADDGHYQDGFHSHNHGGFHGHHHDGFHSHKQDGFHGHHATDDLLSRLGRAAWDTLESWVGPQPLWLVTESLSTTVWVISSGISVALTTLCGILGDLLATSGMGGERLVRTAALGPGEVQRVLAWGLAAAAGSWALARLQGLLLPALRWVKIACFLGAFLNVAASQETPTAKAGMLLGLWLLYALLGRLWSPSGPSTQLDAAVRNLEWKVEELRRRQKWGGPRNREE